MIEPSNEGGSDMNTDKIYAEKLASEYAPKDTSKVLRLKKLDRKAKLPANIFGYTFGTVMALVLGVGMCLCMKVIGRGDHFRDSGDAVRWPDFCKREVSDPVSPLCSGESSGIYCGNCTARRNAVERT